ncbi:MAG: hypothetical protein H7301_10120 [Cryobacterium sp.]|nr:hypothetical protein [Oligoflexia bacterium]
MTDLESSLSPEISPEKRSAEVSESAAFRKQFLFVQGKGGVGKSTLAHAYAQVLSKKEKTLLVSIEDPLRAPFDLAVLSPTLHHLNNEATSAFEEYAGIKIGAPRLVKVFLQNRFMRYLAKAAPGIRELVLLGKIWYERKNYARIVIDMPATGHGLTMFQSLFNWGALFDGSPLAKDASDMIKTFSDPKEVGHAVISLAEEMPLVESLELRDHIVRIFPKSDIFFVANRLFPAPTSNAGPFSEALPEARTAAEHAYRKSRLEKENLAEWKKISYLRVPFFPPRITHSFSGVVAEVTALLSKSEGAK